MKSPELIMDQAKAWFSGQHNKTEQFGVSVDNLKKEWNKLKKEEDRYVKAYGAGVITMEQLKEHADGLKEKMSLIKGQMLSL